MNTTELEQMKKYGITHKQKIVYTYKEYHYDQLKDAVKYAEIDKIHHLKDNDKQEIHKKNNGE